MTYVKKTESRLRYQEARRRLRRALDTEWQVERDRILNDLDEAIAAEFTQADVQGELLAVDDGLLRSMARDALAGRKLELLPGRDDVQD